MAPRDTDGGEIFHLILIRPTHYDDEGYPIQWWRSQVSSGSLGALYSLAEDCRDRQVLGPGVRLRIIALDESNRRVVPTRILDGIERSGGKALVGLVGVQSCQFPRAMDLARPFLDRGIPVCVGGFHVTGSAAMLPELPPELREAQRLGVSLFLGEAEGGRLDEVLCDAYGGRLRPVYDHLGDLPDLAGQPTPFLPRGEVVRTQSEFACVDMGRGCPFHCSFCTIINVQGHESRFRTPDDLERIIRKNYAQGIDWYYLTDDNLARNANWEALFDRLIALRQREGIAVRLLVQVDMMSHRIPGFIDQAVAAGVDQIFVGLESINPDNLKSIGKKQNRVGDYREMLLAWKRHPVVIIGGYIIGFEHDTPESVTGDIETIQRELPIDLLYFTNLTPLPGSRDHQRLHEQGTWLDPDLNNFDANHRVTHHPRMSDEAWDALYRASWERYYSWDHMETILRRMTALGSNKKLSTVHRMTWFRDYLRLNGVHAFDGGLLRVRARRDRRPGLPREKRRHFYPRYAAHVVKSSLGLTWTYCRLRLILRRVWKDPKRFEYGDLAIGTRDTRARDSA